MNLQDFTAQLKYAVSELLAGGPGSGRKPEYETFEEARKHLGDKHKPFNKDGSINTTIKKDPEFHVNGEWHIFIGKHHHRIFKDPATTNWYESTSDLSPTSRPLSMTTKDAAVKALVLRHIKNKDLSSAYQPTNKTLLTPGYKNPGSMSVPKKQSKLLKKNPFLKEDVDAGGPGSGRHKGFTEYKEIKEGIPAGKSNECQSNSARTNRKQGLTTVVGVLKERKPSGSFKNNHIPHAWNIDKDGKVVDTTLGSKEAKDYQYIGREVPHSIGKNANKIDEEFYAKDIKKTFFSASYKTFSAGGPGSGRHKGLDTLQKTATEESLEKRRAKQAAERAELSKQGKSTRGKPILSEKAQRAKANVVTATKEHHDKAEEVERMIAKKIGGQQSADNKPFDVTKTDSKGKNHAIEVKALLMQKNDKITMKQEAIQRKNKWAKQNKSKVHTVAVDLRGPKPIYYHRPSVGSFRLGNMTKVEGGLAGLSKLFA